MNWPRALLWIALCTVLLAAAFFLDEPVHQWVRAHYNERLEHIARAISLWGDAPMHIVVALLGTLACLALGNRRWTLILATILIACLIGGILHPTIKNLAGRSRPNVKVQVGWRGPMFEQKYQSFPSGHTTVTSAFFATLLMVRRRLGLALLPIPLLIASTRVYLSAHWLSDVVAGAILGWCCALIAWRMMRARYARLTSD